MRSRPLLITLVTVGGLALCLILGGVIYNIPAVNERVYPRIERFVNDLRERVDPVQAVVPTTVALADLPTFVPNTSTPTPQPSPTTTPLPEQPTGTPTATPIPIVYNLPSSIMLEASRREAQLMNNCGPATLVGALTYWGWRGSEPDDELLWTRLEQPRWQRDIASVIKPQQNDKNVMPYELANYSEEYAGLKTVIRYGGNLDTLRALIANGFPVVIERGFREEEHGLIGQGWEGHYGLVKGYDDVSRVVFTQDSYKLDVNYSRTYDQLLHDWRDFNYVYLVVYPPEREGMVLAILGPDADPGENLNRALLKAQADAAQHEGNNNELTFDWFNIGTSLQLLGRNDDAALAYDQSRSYGTLPYRMLWYQTYLYKAYYFSGRYQDVIDLATVTLDTVTLQPRGLEENYYWRGWAYYQKGNVDAAIADMRAALDDHPDWDQALDVLAQWGVTP